MLKQTILAQALFDSPYHNYTKKVQNKTGFHFYRNKLPTD